MPQVFYPCCEVGERLVAYGTSGKCWMCGESHFKLVDNMSDSIYSEDGLDNDFYYYKAVVHGRWQSATGIPPWQ